MTSSIVIRSRVSDDMARTLRMDIALLGLEGVSQAISEALGLLHHKAQLCMA